MPLASNCLDIKLKSRLTLMHRNCEYKLNFDELTCISFDVVSSEMACSHHHYFSTFL
jgi:hypothetical protein